MMKLAKTMPFKKFATLFLIPKPQTDISSPMVIVYFTKWGTKKTDILSHVTITFSHPLPESYASSEPSCWWERTNCSFIPF